MSKNRKPVRFQFMCVAHTAISHKTTHAPLSKTEKLNVSTYTVPRSNRCTHQDGVRVTELKCTVLWAFGSGGLISRDVGPLWNES